MFKKNNQIVGFVASCFDLGPHAGHISMLSEAKNFCDVLVVGLHVNPQGERPAKNKPVENISERYLKLTSCKFVDHVIPYETEDELLDLLLLVNPDVRFLGSDYIDKEFTGHKLNLKVHFCSRSHSISSSKIRQRITKCSEKQS